MQSHGKRVFVAALALGAAMFGCSDDKTSVAAGVPDAGDAGGAVVDAGGTDASEDASQDAGPDASGPTQTVGGTVSGLAAGSVVLQDNAGDDLTVSKNGTFTFATPIARGATYDVKVKTQPPGQQCLVTNGSGTIAASDVTSVVVACDDTLPCPIGSTATKQTICGRLYDLADGAPLQADTACTACPVTPTATGPCALKVTPYEGVAFALDPAGAPPLAAAESVLDTCGRFRVKDIAIPSSPTILLVVDDAAATANTVPVAVAVAKAGGTATRNLEGWIATPTTVQGWASSGGPTLAGGIFMPIFRAHMDKPGNDRFANQSGVAVTNAGNVNAAADSYFANGASARTTIDASATATGANGTALVTGASLGEGPVYSGTGLSDPTNCRWETRSGASIPSAIFVQVFRPTDQVGKTCPL